MADYFQKQLGWESLFAYNDEVLGEAGTLRRCSERDVILTRYLRRALEQYNPGLPHEAYHEHPENNHFLVVRELWVQGALYRRRPDIICFVNGISLVFIELKNIHKDIRRAYNENLSDYRDTIPHLFDHVGFLLLGNGHVAKIGTITSKFKHYFDWKRLKEEDKGTVDMETLQKGVFNKAGFMDLFENFILFDESTYRVPLHFSFSRTGKISTARYIKHLPDAASLTITKRLYVHLPVAV